MLLSTIKESKSEIASILIKEFFNSSLSSLDLSKPTILFSVISFTLFIKVSLVKFSKMSLEKSFSSIGFEGSVIFSSVPGFSGSVVLLFLH